MRSFRRFQIYDFGFQIEDCDLEGKLLFGGANGSDEDGDEFVALLGELSEACRLEDTGLAEEFEPIECFVSFTKGDFQSCNEVPTRGGA